MFEVVANVMAWFYSLIPNYAVAIGLVTLTVMVLVTPLTLKGTKGMLEMQRIQPEMRRIQQEYKGDRQKMNEELMKLYQEHKVNPLGGCLPLLIQAPIFIILYRVLIGLTHRGPQLPGGPTPPNFDPKYLSKSSEMYQDLHQTNVMDAFGLDLSQPATAVLQESFVKAIPYLLLVAVVAVLSYVQQWQISARNKNMPVNPQQKILLRVLPGFFAVISLTLPSGIIFYFLVSNLYRIAQQAYITRKFYKEDHAAEVAAEAAKETPPKPSPTKGETKPKPTPSTGTASSAPTSGAVSGGSPPPARPTPPTSGPRPARPRPQPKKKT